MSKPKCQALMNKAVSACLAAIEVYNKPTFNYREETFAILMINGWELMLKARILQLNGNKLRPILQMEPKRKKNGDKSKVLAPKTNRSGNYMTIGLQAAMRLLKAEPNDPLPSEVIENVTMLEEIRDNSIHFHNYHLGLGAKMQEAGAASLRNFVRLAQRWFECDLSKYNFYLMPMSFHNDADVIESFSIQPLSKQLNNLVAYFTRVEKQFPSDETRDYNVALRMEAKFVRTASPDAIKMQVTKELTALQVTVTEEDIMKGYPFSYDDLLAKVNARYTDFKANRKFYKVKREIEACGEPLCRSRLLDPNKPSGVKKVFYSGEFLRELDKVYTRK